MLVRIVAIALIGFSLAYLIPTVAEQLHAGSLAIFPCILRALPAIVGVAILIKARAVAEWLDDLLDG